MMSLVRMGKKNQQLKDVRYQKNISDFAGVKAK